MAETVLYSVTCFDAKLPLVFRFEYYGNQLRGNKLTIRDNLTNDIVYEKEIVSMKNEHSLSPDGSGLLNGRTYNAQLYALPEGSPDYDGISNQIIFDCYSTPVLAFKGISSGDTIRNASFQANIEYSQAEGILLSSYRLLLFDAGQQLLWQSPTVFPAAPSPYSIREMIYDLDDNKEYYLQCVVETVKGIGAESERLKIRVSYTLPEQFSVINAENAPDSCAVKISANLVLVDGKCNNTEPVYIDGDIIDLTGGDFVIYDEGIDLQGDYEIKLTITQAAPYKTILEARNTRTLFTLKLMRGELFGTTGESYYFVLRAENGKSNFVTVSQRFNSHSPSDIYIVVIRLKGHQLSLFAYKIQERGA